jgi:D-3-phosphoglycerate dehydrogenase
MTPLAVKKKHEFLVVHADARPGAALAEEGAELAGLDFELRPTRSRDEDELIANVRDADVILVSGVPITRRVMEHMSRCRAVVRYGVGVDNVDLEAATDHGIVVAHVLDFCTEEVANHALLLLLACAKRLVPLDRDLREGRWSGTPLPDLPAIFGQTLGIVGFGNIGQALAHKAQALGLEVVACDPYVDTAFAEQCGVRLLPLEDLLRRSDYVSLNCPATAETCDLMGARELALMKPTAILINTARGTLVDEEALVEALRSGGIAGAGLDVFAEEPLPAGSPLRHLDNVVLTPHTAGFSERSIRLVRAGVGKAAADVLSGRWPRYVANPAVRPRVHLRREHS